MEGAGDPLKELLRRAHPPELLELCRILRVRGADLGFSRTVDTLARRLRQAGGHEIWNLLRRGEGPPYAQVLEDLLRRKELVPTGSIAGDEQALVRWSFERSWEQMTEAERSETWRRLELDDPPHEASRALEVAKTRLGAAFPYRTAAVVAGGVVRVIPFLGPFAWFLTVWWLFRPKDHRLVPAVLEVARLRQVVEHRVTIGIVGSPSSGKDAGMKALFGIETGNVSPIAGSTREVQIAQIPGPLALYVVNTPGMGDVVESVTEEARAILALIDVFVYVVNAQGGVQQRERDDHARCAATGRPVVVVLNKVDTLREADRDRMCADTAKKLGVEAVLPVAFDPLPQLAPAPLGIEVLRGRLRQELVALGKSGAELSRAGLVEVPAASP